VLLKTNIMKKFFSIIALGPMTLSISGFSSAKISSQSDRCMNLQHDAFAFHYMNNGGDIDAAWTESIQVYERCERMRGNY